MIDPIVFDQCQAGHPSHERLRIDLNLHGAHHGLPDIPGIPDYLAHVMRFEVYNYQRYRDTPGYCTGDDVVSFSIYTQGVWEGFETLLALDILHRGDRNNLVLDFGGHIGWYSTLAAIDGYRVTVFEIDNENIDMLICNAELNRVAHKVTPINLWVDEHSPTFSARDGEQVEFLKCDIEGNEQHAFAMTRHLFEQGRVNYALLEISPVFNDTYPDLACEIADLGYRPHMVPHKRWEHSDAFGESPLAVLTALCEIPRGELAATVASWSQENMLFIREGCL